MNSLLDNMEADVSKPTIGDNSLKEVSDLCSELASEQNEYEELEKMLKDKAKNIRKLSEEIIPARMAELGLESLTLKDGSQIKVKQKVQASIPVRFREDAFQWLRDNDPQQKLWVEPMTLKAFVREQINEGKEIPMEKFGVFVGAETKISKK